MKLSNLERLHKEMKKLNISVDIFDYNYNDVECSVIFNADYQKGFTLTFFKTGNAEMLKLPVKSGYNLEIQGNNFHQFCRFFNIKRQKGAFSILEFFDHLNKRIPTLPTQSSPQKRNILSAVFPIEESEKIHFDHLINWEKARVKNPKLKKGRDPKNLEKTRLLYPDLFNSIKDHDISVAYSVFPKENEIVVIEQELNEELS
ncbi:DUF6037 family protein [Enterococcus wangshanyuanii]|uniref:Uncharacterized protein n=1 Tax=Enterococcus wangshanyuanii TaxID=2005703 RepID=A0ABQ1PRI0_9ENTE|nr:DUF6037 family protein [Enterococcus wangshanyuanii]GGD01738.1 hypothetical protein GCM10011573_34080 [Enterococcus wangshanyuanii]